MHKKSDLILELLPSPDTDNKSIRIRTLDRITDRIPYTKHLMRVYLPIQFLPRMVHAP